MRHFFCQVNNVLEIFSICNFFQIFSPLCDKQQNFLLKKESQYDD